MKARRSRAASALLAPAALAGCADSQAAQQQSPLLFDEPDFVALLRAQACREAREVGVTLSHCPVEEGA